MIENELVTLEKQVKASLLTVQNKLKEQQKTQEDFEQVSRESHLFFQETLDFLRGSSDSYRFQGFYDEQAFCDRSIKRGLEGEYDDLKEEQGRLLVQLEELSLKGRQLKREEG